MEIVIKISEDVYTRLFDPGIQDNEIATDDTCEMARALRLGEPLPKGHDRLIYASDVGEYLTLADVPTIIEADKEVVIDEKL